MHQPSEKTKDLKQSGIRAASSRCDAIGGINLGQGVCDIAIEEPIKEAAYAAIKENKSLYSPCEGILPLRKAIANKMASFNLVDADPESEIIVTLGATGAYICAITTLFNPGDEIILFEPFYGYHKNILELKGMSVKSVPLNLQDLSFDPKAMTKAIGPNTKGIVICTPNNPSGKIYSKEELLTIGNIAKENNLWVITDEIYEYITYPGYEHISFASLEDFKDFTITISGFSKTYNMTGWRLGYAIGPAAMMEKMALVQDLIYVCPATPLQHAALAGLAMQEDYYTKMQKSYLYKRDLTVNTLRELGFKVASPQGAYYLLADFSELNFEDDEIAAKFLLEKAKVATVPGRYFYQSPEDGKHILRLCYAMDKEKIELALAQIKQAIK